MMTMKIYDPAMCCSTGLCGPKVDNKLVQLAAFLSKLDANQYQVERYNLAQQPEAYSFNAAVSKQLQEKGVDALPLFFVDDQLKCSGHYPEIKELSGWLKISGVEEDPSGGFSGGCC